MSYDKGVFVTEYLDQSIVFGTYRYKEFIQRQSAR